MRFGYPMLYFLKFKDLTCNFCAFSHFIYFSVSFYPIWMKILSKFRENVGLQAYRLGLVLNRSWTGLRIAVFSGLSQKNWEDRDHWSAWTGYSPVRFSVPFRSYEPDLEALDAKACENSDNLFQIQCDRPDTNMYRLNGNVVMDKQTSCWPLHDSSMRYRITKYKMGYRCHPFYWPGFKNCFELWWNTQ